MMQNVVVVILVIGVAQARDKEWALKHLSDAHYFEHSSNAHHFVDNLVDKLIGRLLQCPSLCCRRSTLQRHDLDDTLLAKRPGHLDILVREHRVVWPAQRSARSVYRSGQPRYFLGASAFSTWVRHWRGEHSHRHRNGLCIPQNARFRSYGASSGGNAGTSMGLIESVGYLLGGAKKAEDSFDVEFVLQQLYESVFGGVDPPQELLSLTTSTAKEGRSVGISRVRTTDGAFATKTLAIYDDGEAMEIPSNCDILGYDGKDMVWAWENITKHRVELDLDDKDLALLWPWSVASMYALPRFRRHVKLNVRMLGQKEARQMGAREREVCLSVWHGQSASSEMKGFVTAYLFIDTETWLPKRIMFEYYGSDRVIIEMSSWRPSEAVPSMIFPSVQVWPDGHVTMWAVRPWSDASEFNPVSLSTRRIPTLKSLLLEPLPAEIPAEIHAQNPYKITWKLSELDIKDPYIGPVAGDDITTTFNAIVGNEVKILQNPYGALLISALINGKNMGYWMLDTGASQNVMSESACKKYNLSIFGEGHERVAGRSRNVQRSFVKVKSFTAGPMNVKDSIFTVMDLANVIPPALRSTEHFAGILGGDFFRRTIIEIHNDCRGGNMRAFIYDPRNHTDLERAGLVASKEVANESSFGLAYSPLKFIGQRTYVNATIQGDCEFPPSQQLRFLDLGANCYYRMLFNEEKARKAGVIDRGYVLFPPKVLKGPGRGNFISNFMGWAINRQALAKYVDIGGFRIESPGIWIGLTYSSLEDSNFANGVLCARLFDDCRIIIDYPRRQFGVGRLKKEIEREKKQISWAKLLGFAVPWAFIFLVKIAAGLVQGQFTA